MDAVKLVALRAPLAPAEFPNGKTFAVRDMDAFAARLVDEARAEVSEEKYRQVLELICPDATPADFDSLTGEDMANLIMHASSKNRQAIALVEERRKNGDAGSVGATTTPTTRRSSRTTRSRTSAAGSLAATPAAVPSGP